VVACFGLRKGVGVGRQVVPIVTHGARTPSPGLLPRARHTVKAIAGPRPAADRPDRHPGRTTRNALQWRRVSRPLRLIVLVLTVTVIVALGEIHAHFIAPHPYSF